MKNMKGFTLIEITLTLVIIGILAAVAAPKYFDMQEAAEKQAAIASVAEAQARVNARFGEELLSGKSCSEARTVATDLASLSDGGSLFGKFKLESSGDWTGETGMLTVTQVGGTSEWNFNLALPVCNESNANLSQKAQLINSNISSLTSVLDSYFLPDNNYSFASKGYFEVDNNINKKQQEQLREILGDELYNQLKDGYIRIESQHYKVSTDENDERYKLYPASNQNGLNNTAGVLVYSSDKITSDDSSGSGNQPYAKYFIEYNLATKEYSVVMREIKTTKSYVNDDGDGSGNNVNWYNRKVLLTTTNSTEASEFFEPLANITIKETPSGWSYDNYK